MSEPTDKQLFLDHYFWFFPCFLYSTLVLLDIFKYMKKKIVSMKLHE